MKLPFQEPVSRENGLLRILNLNLLLHFMQYASMSISLRMFRAQGQHLASLDCFCSTYIISLHKKQGFAASTRFAASAESRLRLPMKSCGRARISGLASCQTSLVWARVSSVARAERRTPSGRSYARLTRHERVGNQPSSSEDSASSSITGSTASFGSPARVRSTTSFRSLSAAISSESVTSS